MFQHFVRLKHKAGRDMCVAGLAATGSEGMLRYKIPEMLRHISPYLPYISPISSQVRKEIGGLAIPDGIVTVSGTRTPLQP